MANWTLPTEVASWITHLACLLHATNAWRLQPLLVGMLFARGRRTVSSWLRAGELSNGRRLTVLPEANQEGHRGVAPSRDVQAKHQRAVGSGPTPVGEPEQVETSAPVDDVTDGRGFHPPEGGVGISAVAQLDRGGTVDEEAAWVQAPREPLRP